MHAIHFPGIKSLSLILAIVLLSLIHHSAYAGNPTQPTLTSSQSIVNGPDWVFRENKGQLGLNLSDIRYYGRQGSVFVFCKANKISFVFSKTEINNKTSEAVGWSQNSPFIKGAGRFDRSKHQRLQPIKISTSRIELALINPNPSVTISATDQQTYFENYYTTGDANHGITNVHTFKTIIYKEIYPHIDMVLSAKKQGMEYSFIVHPGGKLSDIKLRWNGVDKSEALKNGGIEYDNSLGNIKQSAPKSFVNEKEIQSRLNRKNSYFGFRVGDYDKNKDLVIDPDLIWATYFGGSGDEYGNAVKADDSNNVIITGYTSSNIGIASSGADQANYAGDIDIFLAKFSSSGSRLWSTYYGGNLNDVGYGLCTDDSANIYLTGFTASDSGLATIGSNRTAGGSILLSKFNSSGYLKWGCRYGGMQDDYGYGVTIDAFKNLYITGSTGSGDGIATIGANKTSFGGTDDAFVAKFNNSGSLLWGSYYGGKNVDYGAAISADTLGNIYITGPTLSDSGISTSFAYQSALAGTGDAFIAKFNSSGKLSWGTYYGGNNFDQGESISTDRSGNVFITGFTGSSNGTATSGTYMTSFFNSSGYVAAFLAKFSSSGALLWGTYFGGDEGADANGICLDNSGNVFIAGNTESMIDIATFGSYQTANAGNQDAYIAKFNNSGKLIWASYYGGGEFDEECGISSDGSDNLYIIGLTQSRSRISTSGAFQTLFGGGDHDAFLAKFKIPHTSGISPEPNPDLYKISISPNPFSDKTNINFTLPASSHVKISLTDIEGKLIFIPADKTLGVGLNEIEINTTDYKLSSGAYFLNININDQVISRKIIVETP